MSEAVAKMSRLAHGKIFQEWKKKRRRYMLQPRTQTKKKRKKKNTHTTQSSHKLYKQNWCLFVPLNERCFVRAEGWSATHSKGIMSLNSDGSREPSAGRSGGCEGRSHQTPVLTGWGGGGGDKQWDAQTANVVKISFRKVPLLYNTTLQIK